MQNDRSRGARAKRGLGLIGALVVLVAVGAAALARLSPPPPPAGPQPAADRGAYDVRLAGSAEIGGALAPALVEAWLVSRGADTVDVSQRKAGETPLPERVVSARIGARKMRIDVRAYGERAGLSDIAHGHADIAMLVQPSQASTPSSGVTLGETRTVRASAASQRLLLLPAPRASAEARAFLIFAGSDAGKAIVEGAGFSAPVHGVR